MTHRSPAGQWRKWTKGAEIVGGEKAATRAGKMFEVTVKEGETWGMKGKLRGGRWRKMLWVEVDFVCLCRIRRMAAAQVPCSGR